MSKQVDLLVRDQQARVFAVEIAGNPEHEVHNALAVLGASESVARHVIVCVSKDVLEAVKARLKRHGLLEDERIRTVTLAKALRKDWMP